MTKMMPMLIFGFIWAWATQITTYGRYGVHKQPAQNKFLFAMLVITLALPITLRRTYNDTGTYISTFYYSDTLQEVLTNGSLHLLRNPAFVAYRSFMRGLTDNYMLFFMFPAFFVQYSYMRFIRRHCPNFVIGVALYFFLGTYTFSIAAMKQTIAMAVLLYAVDFLIERKHIRFYLTVFLAFLFHTYAICFLILPLFTVKPWTPRTFLLLFAVLFFMGNFESVITTFLDVANESGKHVSSSEILGTASINPIRVAVYAVTPLFALVFRRYLFSSNLDREYNILVNMTIITVMIMSIGLISAANMFARMAQYFEFGLICSLPWMMSQPFEKQSSYLVNLLALVCFAAYFIYANVFWMPFDDHFGRYTVMEFLETLWQSYLFG